MASYLNTKSGPGAWLLYVLVRIGLAVLQSLPIKVNLRFASVLAIWWKRIMPRHHARAVTHLAQSFDGAYTPDQIRRIADECLVSVTAFAVETICLPRLINSSTWWRYIHPKGFEEALDVMLQGRGAILVTGHYGSFELLGHLLAALGFDITALMRPLDNRRLNRFIVRTRRLHGLSLLDKKGAIIEAEGILDRGELLAFIGDQDAGRKGVFVDFFGRPASTYKSIGLLAMSKNVPIIVGYARRRICQRTQAPLPKYDVGIERVIYPHEWQNRSDPLKWITQTYTSAIEAFIRKDPGQYLWMHRRWKSVPRTRREDDGKPTGDAAQVSEESAASDD